MEISHPFRFTCLAIHSGDPLRLFFQATISRSTSWRSIHTILLWLSFLGSLSGYPLATLLLSYLAILSGYPSFLAIFFALISGDHVWGPFPSLLFGNPFWLSFLAIVYFLAILAGNYFWLCLLPTTSGHPAWLSLLALLSGDPLCLSLLALFLDIPSGHPAWLSFLDILSGGSLCLSFLSFLHGYPFWRSFLVTLWQSYLAIISGKSF